MALSRRHLIAAAAGASLGAGLGHAAAQSYGQRVAVTGDDGRPVANSILPGEITGQIPGLRGVTYAGPREAQTTLYEFFDFNCPYCRKAAADVVALHESDPDLRVGLVNNPILSPQSAQAAKVMLAVQRKLGAAAAWGFYRTLLSKPGGIDGPGALAAAARARHPAGGRRGDRGQRGGPAGAQEPDADGSRPRPLRDALVRPGQQRDPRSPRHQRAWRR